MTWYAVESDRGHTFNDNGQCAACRQSYTLHDRGDGIDQWVNANGEQAPRCTR